MTITLQNILDLILTNSPDSIFNLHIHDNLPLPIPYDHYTITFDVVTFQIPNKANSPIHLLNFSKGDYDGLSLSEYRGLFTLFSV